MMQQLLATQALAGQKGKATTGDEETGFVVVEGEKYEKVDNAMEINDGVLAIKVEFNFDSDVIRKNSYPDLDRIIKLMKSTPVDIVVAGHTDSTGPDEYNEGLSLRRAKSVYNYLVGKGVDEAKLITKGYGENRPLSTNSSIDGRRRNRRVDFIRGDQMDKYDEKFSK